MKNSFSALAILALLTTWGKGWGESSFQTIPKAELHLHLGGAFPKDYLLSIATPEEQVELVETLELVANRIDYNSVFATFGVIAKLVNTEEKLQKGVDALCNALKEDGVHYVEIRTGLKDLGQGYEAYLQAVLEGMSVHLTDNFVSKLILSLQRSSTPEMTELTLNLARKYQNRGIVGIDLSGDATIGQVEQVISQLQVAKEAGLSMVVHMGEHPDEADQMLLLKELMPDRIGHGIHLTKAAKEWIVAHRIPVEVCLTSSVLVKVVEDYPLHPGIELYKQGHPIILCTDDPLLFSTSLSRELELAHQLCGLSRQDIENIVKNSFKYAMK